MGGEGGTWMTTATAERGELAIVQCSQRLSNFWRSAQRESGSASLSDSLIFGGVRSRRAAALLSAIL
jgi:hypothetical protein